MIEVNASFRSVEASVTKLEAYSEKSSLALRADGHKPQSSLLNPQEAQIVDEVGISDAALQKFQDVKILADQLQDYLDYLNGNQNDDDSFVSITANDNAPDITIAGESTKLAASVTVATYKEESLDVNAKFDDNGNLQELSISKETISAEYVQADVILNQQQFFAQI